MTLTEHQAGAVERLAARNGHVELPQAAAMNGASPSAAMTEVDATIVALEDFVAVDEPGASALLGDGDSALIPEGGDVMVYGDGGAGKTTLTIDLACHLAAGVPWLEIPVVRPVRVLLIENEGPRPLLRRKFRRKLQAWSGPPLDGRLSVLAEPWGQFTLGPPEWRAELAAVVRRDAIDVVIAGPLTRIGMDDAGTLQEVVRFMELVADVRRQCERLLTVILVHHENKAGSVSGAWEGSGDTLLHVQAAGTGHTIVAVRKARWSSELHGKTLHLAWTDGEGFELEGPAERDLRAEIAEYLREHPHRTAKEIAAPADAAEPGVGANESNIRAILKASPDLFEACTGDAAVALAKPHNAKLYSVSQGSDSADSPPLERGVSRGAQEPAESPSPSLKDSAGDERTPGHTGDSESTPPTHPTQRVGGMGD